ncbi:MULTISPECIES: hypothetical protein [Bacillus]|uniref:hypothetical protein n=1 Tax=Bacillus TaxID=1386 RepID=UPI001E5A9F3C|nr:MULTISPECIES: hypothetical protein [unclassified Bacillus (in: firmicutes)]
MSKRRDSLTISEDLSNIFSDRLKSDPRKKETAGGRYTFNLTIDKAIEIVVRQMCALNKRYGNGITVKFSADGTHTVEINK